MNLTIYTPMGRTFTFKDVVIFTNNEYALDFSYYAMSDGQLKVGHFIKQNIVGWSEYAPTEYESEVKEEIEKTMRGAMEPIEELYPSPTGTGFAP